MTNLLKVPEIFALNMSRAADMKAHFLTVEILSICSITFEMKMGKQNVKHKYTRESESYTVIRVYTVENDCLPTWANTSKNRIV